MPRLDRARLWLDPQKAGHAFPGAAVLVENRMKPRVVTGRRVAHPAVISGGRGKRAIGQPGPDRVIRAVGFEQLCGMDVGLQQFQAGELAVKPRRIRPTRGGPPFDACANLVFHVSAFLSRPPSGR